MKGKAAAIATVLLLCSAVSTPNFFSNMEIVHWTGFENINTILQYATSLIS